jgi:putative ABC transport system permease protein
MNLGEDVRLAFRWVVARPVETLLLVLGISLGIGATAAGIALAGRTSEQARELLASTRYREIVVNARASSQDMDLPAVASMEGDTIILTTADLAAREDAPDVQYAYVASRVNLRLGTFAGPEGGAPPEGAPPEGAEMPEGAPAPEDSAQQTEEVSQPEGPQPVLEEITGYEVSPEFFSAWNMNAAEGSLFTLSDIQEGQSLLVLGSQLAATLYEDGQPLGRQVLAQRKLYTIVGILEPTGTDYDGMAFTAATMAELTGQTATARMFQRFDASLHFTVTDASRLEQARAQLATWFDQHYGEASVTITVPRAEAEASRDRNVRLVTVILFLATSALLIATANVTNILGSRAMRKRRSVGILKALGASSGGVFRLFFLEAALIGSAGAALGTGISILLSRLMQQTMGFGAAMPGLLVAGIIGAVALVTALDIFPAMQAARTPAAEAIRYE